MNKGKLIHVCKNHENALYYWCKAKKEMNVDAFFLVAIDKHKDLLGLPLNVKRELMSWDLNDLDKIKEKTMCERGVRDRSGNLKSKLAYNQFLAAMEVGLVLDILIVSPEVPCEKVYKDLSGRQHIIFHCDHPTDLKAIFKSQSIKQSLGYPEGKKSVILDIDLDFFTYLDDQEEAHVISEEDFGNIFSKGSPIWWIYEKAKLVTISKEPFWCGGVDNSERIFELLKRHLLSRTET